LREYHLSRVDDDGDGLVPLFKWSPFDGIPFEILAIISLDEVRVLISLLGMRWLRSMHSLTSKKTSIWNRILISNR